MAPRPPKAHRAVNREATQTGRPLSNASKVVKHATSKKPQQTRLPIRPVRPVLPLLSAEQPVSFANNSTTAATTSLASDVESDDDSMGSDDVLMGSDDDSMGSDDISMGSDNDSMGSDDDSIGSDYVRIDYVQRKRIVENVGAYSAQFEKCGVSYFKEATFFSKMREFRNASTQIKRLRNGGERKLRLMVKDFGVQFGSMFWPGDESDVDSDEEMDTEDEDGDEKMDEEDDGAWIAEGVYEYFTRMQRLRFKEK